MIIKNEIITDLKIISVNDLYKLKPFMEGTSLKINKSLNKEGVTVRYETWLERSHTFYTGYRRSCWSKHVCIGLNNVTKEKGLKKKLLSPFIYRLFAIIPYYSIIVATLPEPTVLPPSRNYFIIIWYILFDFSCFHCTFWFSVLSLFIFAQGNDDSLTTPPYLLLFKRNKIFSN